MGIPALPFYRYERTVAKYRYPSIPKTLGEHIRKARIERGLLQRKVAEVLAVCEDSVTHWETNYSAPQIHCYTSIIQFLGYYPFSHETDSLSGKLQQLRHCRGYSYKQLGISLDVDGSTARSWELEKHKPNTLKQSLIIQLWSQLPEFITLHSQLNTNGNERTKS
jgi:DNA-binding XRE family transcriptional regulator